MSEQAPERVAPSSRAGGGGGNVFTNKIGPLPMWAWLGVAAGILVVWRVMAGRSSASSQATTTPSSAADQVPQFVNQTYLSTTAPLAPTTGDTSAPTQPSPFTPTMPGQPGPTTPMPPTPTTPQQTVASLASKIASVTGLRSTGAGATNVNLAWNPVSGAQQYQVRVTYQGKVIKTFMTNRNQYNVTGLSPNRTYGLHVVAINGNDWAPEASITQKTT